jgi:hypothetical protein
MNKQLTNEQAADLIASEIEGDWERNPQWAEALRMAEAALRAQGEPTEPKSIEPEMLASHLIEKWCEANCRRIPWAKAVEITAIVTKMPDTEKARLLALDNPHPQGEEHGG